MSVTQAWNGLQHIICCLIDNGKLTSQIPKSLNRVQVDRIQLPLINKRQMACPVLPLQLLSHPGPHLPLLSVTIASYHPPLCVQVLCAPHPHPGDNRTQTPPTPVCVADGARSTLLRVEREGPWEVCHSF
jgi:hypothetical protein